MKHKNIAVTAITAAILCVFSPVSIPFGAIPVSLATFAICLISAIIPYKQSVAAVIIYILLGAAGLPVFSGFTGGFQQIVGITGGFIIGYIPCSVIVSLLTGKFADKKYIYPLSMAFGIAVCYISGTLWYSLQTGTHFTSAIAVCVIPFIVGDTIKISAASVIGIILRRRLKRYI